MTATSPEPEPYLPTAEIIAFPSRPANPEPDDVVDAEVIEDTGDSSTEVEARPAAVVVRRKLKPNPIVVPASVRRAGELAKRPDRVALAVLKHELVYGSVGTARGLGSLWRWMTAAELDQQLATKPELVLDTRRKRRNIVLAGSGTTLAAGTAAWFLLSPAAPIMALLLVLTVAGAFERRRAGLGSAEAGHAALGPAPSGKEVKRVFVSAKLSRRVEDLRIVGPVTRSGDAWETTVELPPGTTYKAATKKRGEIAAAIGVDEVQVALDPVKGHNGRVRLWVADEDPMQGGPIPSPLVTRTKPVDFWTDKVYAGMDPRGRDVTFSLVERSYLVGGEPGGGKSVACNNILAFAALDPHVRLWLADGKGGFDLADFEPVAERALPEPEHDNTMEMIENLKSEIGRRHANLRNTGHRKVTKDVARKLDMHPILFHIDEIQKFALGDGDTKKGKAFITGVADIVGRGRAAGIITGAVTQRPAADVVPTRLRDILSIRWALRCTTSDASDTVLGTGRAAAGYSAAMFTAEQRGAGYLLSEGAAPIQERTAFMTDDQVAGIAHRAYELRKEAGTLPATADRPEVRLLTAILDAMTHAKGVHTADLLERLAAASEEYAGWDAARLATALKPLGVASKQLDIEGRNRNGYRREHIQDALDRA